MKKYYEILNLKEGSSQIEIKNAYEKLSKELDPKKNDNHEFFIEEYQKVKDAFEKLSNTQTLEKPKGSSSTHNPRIKSDFENKTNKNDKRKNVNNKNMFENPFSSKGRIRRLEYCSSYIIFLIFNSLSQLSSPLIYSLLLIPSFWFICAQGAKRCHDRNASGWFQIIPFYNLWMFFAPGTKGSNSYGDNPKGILM